MFKKTNRIRTAGMALFATIALGLCTGCDTMALGLLQEVMSIVDGADFNGTSIADLLAEDRLGNFDKMGNFEAPELDDRMGNFELLESEDRMGNF